MIGGVAGRGAAVVGAAALGVGAALDAPDPEPDPAELEADVDPVPDAPGTVWWRTTIVVGGGSGSVARVVGSRMEASSTVEGTTACFVLALAEAIPPISSSAAEALAAPTTNRLLPAG